MLFSFALLGSLLSAAGNPADDAAAPAPGLDPVPQRQTLNCTFIWGIGSSGEQVVIEDL